MSVLTYTINCDTAYDMLFLVLIVGVIPAICLLVPLSAALMACSSAASFVFTLCLD